MDEIKGEKHDFVREEVSLADARKLFGEMGQTYKLDLLDDIEKFGTTKIAEQKEEAVKGADGEVKVSIYRTGDFVDLCQGPHVENTKEIGAYKLRSIAGAYWRGDQAKAQLQRIYGLAFANKNDLDAYLKLLEEAEKRDHRKLGKELGLFIFSELVGPGLPLWTPKGTLIRELLNDYVWQLRSAYGYQKVTIPHITKKRTLRYVWSLGEV